ncbi:FkbM family methyltransferase [Mariniflexile litorale]|uniref:FkbM family methyltransferase n=1 Tax=Mariniflexile litorale TaxID=3045158 RepID=A0AAU7EC85_9FLAO|nr:FkbM family methyltransferase [Mariniflexile sp. KMM 9835]MDQ8212203.1 FkbM family methyltransferase [Mariniflexile sp. KMM 9835]
MNIGRVFSKLILRYRMLKKHPLTASFPLSGMFRYFTFNISQTLYPKPRVYNWINGLKFYAEKGDAGLVGNIYYKLMDYEDSMFLIEHLKKEDVFVDVGANLGHYSLLASGICKAKTIAIEPIESTIYKLEKNVALNELEDVVTILKNGVGDKKEILNFTTNRTVMNSVSLEENKNTIKIEVLTLNELLKNESPTFIKIDVEGYEYKVLNGALDILEKPSLKYLLVEFNNSGDRFNLKDDDVFNLIVEHNFVPIRYKVETKEINLIETYNKEKFNTLFIRKDIL